MGQFYSIAAKVRLNPGHHPRARLALGYCASTYDVAEEEFNLLSKREDDLSQFEPDMFLKNIQASY